jgi:hypothetical protein
MVQQIKFMYILISIPIWKGGYIIHLIRFSVNDKHFRQEDILTVNDVQRG